MLIIRPVLESHILRDDEIGMGLSPVCALLVYCTPYVYTEVLAGRNCANRESLSGSVCH